MSVPSDPPKTEAGTQLPTCNCVKDPFADLPPELQPKNRTWKTGFRQAICPRCRLEYWTNMAGDVCLSCKKAGVQIPVTGQDE